MFNEERKKFLEKLVSMPSPSGMEERCTEIFCSYCDQFAKKIYSDRIGNVVYSIGHGKKRILLSGHIDELSMQVIGIDDSGMLIVYPNSIDKKVLPGSSVLVESDTKGWRVGIIGKKPVHAEDSKDRECAIEIEDMLVDLGYSSKDEVLNDGIRVGSYVVYDRRQTKLTFGKSNMVAPGLDDKLGVFMSAIIGEELLGCEDKSWMDEYEILIGSTTQEEVGLRGATVLAANIKPEISIDFDVTPSSDFGVNTKKWGDIKVGNGPVIEWGVDKSRRICALIQKYSSENNIDIQYSVTGRPGGTNTDVFQLYGGDCETMHIALPIRNLHTPVEVCSWEDTEKAIKLVVELIKKKEL